MAPTLKWTVVVTGFGPFRDIQVNPSWEVAKELLKIGFDEEEIKLVIQEIPVVYDTVIETVPNIWNKHRPELVIHMGVSPYATELTLETCAFKTGYAKPDVEKKVPENECWPGEGPECVKTEINVEDISNQLNLNSVNEVPISISEDAGRFLCEFTFYSSLRQNPKKCLFIHVPDDRKPFTTKQIATTVKEIIKLAVNQIHQ